MALSLLAITIAFFKIGCTSTRGDDTTINTNTQDRPNILFFLADDWGFNDVGYYDNTDTLTPFIDNLVKYESLRIDKHYVLPECTVTRCALLTGRYPIRYGMQDGIIQFQSSYALSKHEYLLSSEFQNNGYKTYLIGKWHIGMRNWDYTPNYRGFDKFVGFYGGLINYYDHFGQNKIYKETIDFRYNELEYNEDNTYTLETFKNHVLDIIDNELTPSNVHASQQTKKITDNNQKNDNDARLDEQQEQQSQEPFFMYVAWQGSHSPSEAPSEYSDMYYSEDQHNDYRQYFQAQTTYTDDAFNEIITKLKTNNLWDNTLIIFASDNGGSADYGDNTPLRGGKFTIWEGGIRVPAFITGGYLPEQRRGKILNEFAIHVTDWYQTLLNAANINTLLSTNKLDGENMWDLIINSDIYQQYRQTNNDNSDNSDNSENSVKMIENIENNENSENSQKNGKMIENTQKNDKNNENDKNVASSVIINSLSNEEIASKTDNRYILINVNNDDCDNEVCGALIFGGRWKLLITNNQIAQNNMDNTKFWQRNFALTTNNDILGCGEVPNDVSTDGTVKCESDICLFDLYNDPCEYYDISLLYPNIVNKLYQQLKIYYENEQIPPLNTVFDYADWDDIDPTDTGYWHPWDDNIWDNVEFEIFLSQYYDNSPIKGKVFQDKENSLMKRSYIESTSNGVDNNVYRDYNNEKNEKNELNEKNVQSSKNENNNNFLNFFGNRGIGGNNENQNENENVNVNVNRFNNIDRLNDDNNSHRVKALTKTRNNMIGSITTEQWEALIALTVTSFIICTIYVFVSFRNPANRYKIVTDYLNNHNRIGGNYQSITME